MPQEGYAVQWILITLGSVLLLASALLTLLLRRRNMPTFRRLHLSLQLIRRIQQIATLDTDTQDVATLQSSALILMEQLHRLRSELATSPALPTGDDGEPRILELARDTADHGVFTPDAFVEALINWENTPTSTEVSAFPIAIGAAECQRLQVVLHSIDADTRIRRAARKFARRFLHCKQPYALLDKAGLNSLGLAALAQCLRESDQSEALVLLDRWLSVHEITTEDLAQQDTQRQ